MSLAEAFAAELKEESTRTRSLLELIPDDHFDWRPHPKSMTVGALGSHLAEILTWMGPTLDQEELALDGYKSVPRKNREEILAAFEGHLATGLKVLQGRSDDHLAQVWRLKAGGKVLIAMPRSAVIRFMVLNHTAHHRGQLTVYLRMKDIPLPAIYGPSADNPMPW